MFKLMSKAFSLLWYTSLVLLVGAMIVMVQLGSGLLDAYLPDVLRGSDGDSSAVPHSISEATRAACEKVPPALPEPEIALVPTLVLPLVNDRQMLVTDTLRRSLAEQGNYQPLDPTPLQALWAQIDGEPEPVADAPRAIELAQKTDAERVIFGEVEQLKVRERDALVTVRVRMLHVADGSEVFEGTFSSEETTEKAHGPRPVRLTSTHELTAGRGTAGPWYLTALIGFALFWPVLLVPVMRRVLKMEHNGLTLLTLVLTIAVPVVLSYPWAFGAAGSVGRIVVFAVVGLLASLWSLFVMSRVAEMESAV